MKSDIEIARSTTLKPIEEIANNINISSKDIEPYGHYIAKLPDRLIDKEKVKKSKLILVTAITPTKAGIGKTTVSIGLALGLNKIGEKAIVALREPSLGPCFGMKGGAAGGGYAQVLPMEKINLHFTGDFHAVTSAHNMIAALLDNYEYQHRKEGFALREKLWKRVLDVNDRNLREIVTGIGGKSNGGVSESGFDITPASEIMAILCLSTSIEDLHRRIENILLGITIDGNPFTVRDLGVAGSITVLLLDAIQPNLVQTTENTPAIVHGGPFANIAHGCNSVLATEMAMTYSDYTITEAGFGADLGAEKFFDIKCRKAGLQPSLTVIVATTAGLRLHGKGDGIEALIGGLDNLDRHIENLHNFGQTVVVAYNRHDTDTEEELQLVRKHCERLEVAFAVNNAFAEGGEGATDLAQIVVDTIGHKPSKPLKFTYLDEDTIPDKIEKICKKVYRAGRVTYSKSAENMLQRIEDLKITNYPVCIAKTQYSFSADATKTGAPAGFDIRIRDLVINHGAEMIVAIAGEIMRMPGLPYSPQAERIGLIGNDIDGLS